MVLLPYMSTSSEFPPKGFHIKHAIGTPYEPIDILEQNEGLKLRIDLLSSTVEIDSGPVHQDSSIEI